MLFYWFLPMILFLGIVTSYEDIKYGKIRNKWIVISFIYLTIIYFFLYIFNTEYKLNLIYLTYLSVNGILALSISFLIWFLGLWTAGDAKLFFAYSLLVPQTIIAENINFTFINILVNTFIPIGIYLLFFGLVRTSAREKIFYIKEVFTYKNMVKSALLIFALIWPVNMLVEFFSVKDATILIIIILLFLVYSLEKILFINVLIIIMALSLLRVLFDSSIFLIDTWLHFLLIYIIFVIGRLLIRIDFMAFIKKIPIKKLKPGMLPAELIKKSGSVYKKEKIIFGFFRTLQSKNKNLLYQPKPEGFSNADIKKIKSLSKSLDFNDIKIQETISFAPFLFLGTLLQIFLNDNILYYILIFKAF